MKKITILFAILFAFFVSNAQITADFTWSDPQCSEGTIVFTDVSTGNPAISWSWEVNGAELLIGSPTFSHTFPLVSTPTDFDVSLYVFDGLYPDNITYTITIYPLPDVSISPSDSTICEGGIVTLTASGGVDYEWSTTETGSSISPTVSVPTTYSVTATDGNQCQNVTSTDVDLYLIDTTVVADEFCEASVYDFYGTDLTAPGTYYHTTNSLVTGCDSVIQLDLAMNLIDTTQTVDEFCEGDTYDFLGTPITSPGVYYHTTNSLVTGCDSVTELTLSMHLIDTTVVADEFCEASVYDFYGTDLTAPGTYYYTTNSLVTGCDSVVQLNLTENPTYLIQETHEMCDGDVYSWHGTDYTDAGIYTANYQTSAGCDSIYQLELTVNPTYEFITNESICQGDSIQWLDNWYSIQDTYTVVHSTIYGCDSVYVLNLTIDPLPTNYTVTTNPTNGLLTGGVNGSILLSWSDTDTHYWTTKGANVFTGNTTGTAAPLDLGQIYPPGTYEVWSENGFGCVRKQGMATFTDDLGIPKIVGSASYGPDQLSFVDNAVQMSLYESTVDINDDPVIISQGSQLLAGGNTEFDNLTIGEYYLKSVVLDTATYPDVISVWFFDGMSVDSAEVIDITGANYILAVNINHPMVDDSTGTNTVGGTIDTIAGGSKSGNGIPDQVVILRNEVTGEILSVAITDDNGEYFTDHVPDNSDVELYVTSFEYQNWTPAGISTATDTHYEVNFVVDGNSVYPEGTGIGDIMSQLEFEVYPNPTTDLIYLENISDGSLLQIFDLQGKLVVSDSRSQKRHLDVSYLPTGTYILVITNDGAVGTQKNTKNN